MTWWEAFGAVFAVVALGAGGWSLSAGRRRARAARRQSLRDLLAAHEAEQERGDGIPVRRDEGDRGQW